MHPPLLQAENLSIRFGGVEALRGVSLGLHAGEIHALCGENGAGKSTLIKILTGIHPTGSHEGRVLVEERPVHWSGPRNAQEAGVAVIYQELALVDGLSVAENFFLGREWHQRGWLDGGGMRDEARRALLAHGLDLDPEARTGDLGIGTRQMVEIVRALHRNARILILDEPTAALTAAETRHLLDWLRELRARGVACLYVSHKLEEVFALADRISILRDGVLIRSTPAAATTPAEVIRGMVGREVAPATREVQHPGPERLRVSALHAAAHPGGPRRLRDLSLTVHAGQIVGLAGMLGAGRSELLGHLFGTWGHRIQGDVKLSGLSHPAGCPQASIRSGLVLVGEDRRRQGLVMDQGIDFNLTLSSLRRFSTDGWIRDEEAHLACSRERDRLLIRSLDTEAPAGHLSGGNQQKVVLGRALLTQPRVLLLDEPTRGVDVGAKQEIYQLITALAREGMAILLASGELPELLGLCDVIHVLRGGELAATFNRDAATAESLLAAALGTTQEAA